MLKVIKNCNCTYTSHIVSYILPKCYEEKEPKDEQLFIAVHTINNNIYDTDLLGTSSNIAWSNEHCLT